MQTRSRSSSPDDPSRSNSRNKSKSPRAGHSNSQEVTNSQGKSQEGAQNAEADNKPKGNIVKGAKFEVHEDCIY